MLNMKQVAESGMKTQAKKKSASKDQFIPGLSKRPKKSTVFRDLDDESKKFNSSLVPHNVQDEKERFMRFGVSPNFKYPKGYEPLYKASKLDRYKIKTTLFREAKAIIDKVCLELGSGVGYVNQAFGEKIGQEEANEFINKYIKAHDLEGSMTVYWSPTLMASGKMMWTGPNVKFNKPELRSYSFVIKNSPENVYVREEGIKCLTNHEIGTHYIRYFNDGQQIWFSDRQKFGLCSQSCRKLIATEEGLATINTLVSARAKYLWGAAVLYYTACMAAEMSFSELYEHMAQYVPDRELRWRHIVRVKRGVPDVTKPGGYGHDQVYFEGAVEILRNIDHIDFHLLHCGRICVDELTRIKRLARLNCLKMPLFMRDIVKYKRMLRHIAYINGLGDRPPALRKVRPMRSQNGFRYQNSSAGAPSQQKQTSKPEPDIQLLNFHFKDKPVAYQTPHSAQCSDVDSEEETDANIFGFLKTYDLQQFSNGSIKNRSLNNLKTVEKENNYLITGTVPITARSVNKMQARDRLLKRPTTSPKLLQLQ